MTYVKAGALSLRERVREARVRVSIPSPGLRPPSPGGRGRSLYTHLLNCHTDILPDGLRQRENVKRMPAIRHFDLGCECGGHAARAAAAEAGGDGNVLLAVHGEADRVPLYGRGETRFPHDAAVAHIDRLEASGEISREGESACCGQHRCQKRRALLQRPSLFHRVDIECT